MKRFLLAAAGALFMTGAVHAGTLDDVKARGTLNCGVTQGLPGFSYTDDKGEWAGMDVDFCRAIAAAIFDDPTKVKFSPLSAKDRFTALSSGAVDVLSRNTTWTMSRDTTLGFNFAGVTYYDGQGFLVREALGLKSVRELEGASICVQTGTSNEVNVADYFRGQGMKYREIVAFGTFDEAIKAYQSGRCDVFSADRSQLAAMRLKLTNPSSHVLLPETISKEPLGPLVRHGDDQWFDLVRWTYFALVNAEELGVTRQNVEEMLKSTDPRLKRLLGTEGNYGEDVGVTADWVVRIVRAVGNYGEIYDRNVGPGTPLDIERGINNVWRKGGLHYGMPVR
ncbi:amino acid ABC transporter substrate-binding protein [Xanthobacter sp. TB0136]|uniref:amino acid ABC transporter substrate-binding protein n=1 Tax=Xanthobacter sp. TB0136 TaxID=3459177 RepID=UPI00403993AE